MQDDFGNNYVMLQFAFNNFQNTLKQNVLNTISVCKIIEFYVNVNCTVSYFPYVAKL